MVDHLAPAKRSALMGRIKGKDTKPELLVRRMLHSMGYRYRKYAAELPGKPDIVFTLRRKVVFVHGCFWHRHPGCRFAATPKTRPDFWQAKFAGNVIRDAVAMEALMQTGWDVLVVWECEARDPSIERRLADFLGATRFK